MQDKILLRLRPQGFCLSSIYEAIYYGMTTPSTPQDLLNQIASIQHFEKGKLCVLRQGPNGPFYNFQHWTNGKNVCQYVPAAQVARLQENIKAHHQFESLTQQYVEMLSERSRAERLSEVKKKRAPRNSSSRRKPRSNS